MLAGFLRTVTKPFLSGSKRKREEEHDMSQPVLPLPSGQQAAGDRGPERLDFSSPAVQGNQQVGRQLQGDGQGSAAAITAADSSRQPQQQAPWWRTSQQPLAPSTARRLDEALGTAGATLGHGSGHPAAAHVPLAQPFAKTFAPPRRQSLAPRRANVQLVNVRGASAPAVRCLIALQN